LPSFYFARSFSLFRKSKILFTSIFNKRKDQSLCNSFQLREIKSFVGKFSVSGFLPACVPLSLDTRFKILFNRTTIEFSYPNGVQKFPFIAIVAQL